MSPGISIVVPVLDEVSRLESFLRHVRERAPEAELIVVDGGSRDGTWEVAQALRDKLCFTVLCAPRGRGVQMNAGARAATGEIFWFLHADSLLPARCIEALSGACSDPSLAGGCFRLRMPGRRLIYRVSDSLGNVAVDLFRIALGDHGIFCRRTVFERVGGYREVPLMEDALFYEAMRSCGRVRQLRSFIVTSSRFYEAHGPVRTTIGYALILALYVLRAPIAWLVKIREWISRQRPLGLIENEAGALLSAPEPPPAGLD
jgi:rSAM/selenodomain-associated transferase 2